MEGERLLYREVAGALAAAPIGRSPATAARIRMIDAQVALAIGRGIGQIVLLGAGYDGRALRFGGGSVRWFEVDEAARQADKRRRLTALGREPATIAYVERGPRDRGPGRRARRRRDTMRTVRRSSSVTAW